MFQRSGSLRASVSAVRIIAYVCILSCSITFAQSEPVGIWNLDDGSGTTACDSSGNGNDGTLTNMDPATCWIAGKVDGALSFAGTGDYISVADDSSLNPGTGDFTVELWFKCDAAAANYQGIIGKVNTSTWMGWGLQMISTGVIDFYLNANHNYIAPPYSLNDNAWHHIVIIREGQDAVLYIDGVYAGKSTKSTNADSVSTTYDLAIGKLGSGSVECLIDEVRIYDRALDDSEVFVQYEKGIRPGYWKFDETSGTTASDSSGNGNDGTLTNMDSAACWVNGRVNSDGYFRNVLHFDGTEDYISVADHASLNFGTDDFTVALWLKTDAAAANYQGIIGKVSTSNWMGWGLQMISSGSVDFYLNANHNYIAPPYDLNDDAWHHIAAVRQGQDAILYIDGVYAGKSTKSTNADSVSTTYDLAIGKLGSGRVECLMDDVRIYNIALSADDIAAMSFNFLSPYAEKNYYTSESSATVVCSLAMPASELNGCYLTAVSGGTTLGTNNTPEDSTDLSCDISSLSNGITSVTVELRRDSGDLVFAQDIDIQKKASSSGVEVKINQRNSTVLTGTDGFFPVGLYMDQISSSGTTDFQAAASAGFNSIIRWQNSGCSPTDSTVYLENADTFGLKVIDRHTAYTTEKLSAYKTTTSALFWDAYNGDLTAPYDVDQGARMESAVTYAKTEDNLIGYFTFDEPLVTQIEAGQNLYSRANTADGYHPTLAVYSAEVPDGDEYTDWCDILGFDCYWYPPRVSGDVKSSVNRVARHTSIVCERAKQDCKAFWMVLMSEWWSGSRKRVILPSEQRCQTYLALIHGAKGIFFWRYPVNHDSSWSALSDLAGELTTLAPSMLTADLEQTIDYSVWDSGSSSYLPAELDPANGVFVDVQVSLRKAPAGAGYDYVLLAANTGEYSVDVDYTVSLLGASGTVSRLFDAATYTVSSGGFSDNLDAFATRAYTFNSTSTAAVSIAVDIDPQGSYTEETVHPLSGRENCTNLMQNPSLEDNTLPNWPDYCFLYGSPYNISPRVNTANQAWGLVTDSPYHGSNCLKIVNDSLLDSNGFYFRLAPAAGTYTFSIYLKADQPGYKVRLANSEGAYVNVYPTTSWARYSLTVTIPADVDDHHKFYVLLLEDGTIWADAVQVESGSSASVFTTN